jgi:hypothetical protein
MFGAISSFTKEEAEAKQHCELDEGFSLSEAEA